MYLPLSTSTCYRLLLRIYVRITQQLHYRCYRYYRVYFFYYFCFRDWDLHLRSSIVGAGEDCFCPTLYLDVFFGKLLWWWCRWGSYTLSEIETRAMWWRCNDDVVRGQNSICEYCRVGDSNLGPYIVGAGAGCC